MPAWIIVFALLVLLALLPIGVDASYEEAFCLRLKIGIFRLRIPSGKKKAPKDKTEKQTENKPKKAKKKRSLQDWIELLRLVLDALNRVRKHLKIDVLHLHLQVAAPDPYDAVLRYGRINAALGLLSGPAHQALKIRSEDVRTELDLNAEKTELQAQLAVSLRLWEILCIALCTLRAFRKLNRKQKQNGSDGQEKKGT